MNFTPTPFGFKLLAKKAFLPVLKRIPGIKV